MTGSGPATGCAAAKRAIFFAGDSHNLCSPRTKKIPRKTGVPLSHARIRVSMAPLRLPQSVRFVQTQVRMTGAAAEVAPAGGMTNPDDNGDGVPNVPERCRYLPGVVVPIALVLLVAISA